MSKTLNKLLSSEFIYTTSKSSGPGGQSVNKSNTKVHLRFSIENSEYLTEQEKSMLRNKLGNRINSRDEIYVEIQTERSQLENKKIAKEKMLGLITDALKPEPERIPTSKPVSLNEKRLQRRK
jgi:ribosome-associated protein